MRSLSVTSIKGFVLLPFLLVFSFVILLINGIALNIFQRTQESKNAIQLDQFSLVEIQTIRLVKNQFLTFNPKNFEATIGEWSIKVTFSEETASISFQGLDSIKAIMDYDTVFKSVLNYQIIESSLSNSD